MVTWVLNITVTRDGASMKAKLGLIVQRVCEAAEEERQVKAIKPASQGQWTQWDKARSDQYPGKICGNPLRAVADVLPTPSNLKIWGREEDPSCKQCGASSCTLNHI